MSIRGRFVEGGVTIRTPKRCIRRNGARETSVGGVDLTSRSTPTRAVFGVESGTVSHLH